MNRAFLIFLSILLLSACSQRQFAFRQTVRADKNIAKKEVTRPHKEKEPEQLNNPECPFIDSALAGNDAKPEQQDIVSKKEKKSLLSASTLREIIPFSIDHLSPEEQATPQSKPGKAHDADGGLLGYISLTLGILSILALLSLVFVSSNILGTILLFSAPVLGALALILGIVSVSDNDGKGLGWAGIVMGSFILLITLVFVLIAYLLIQSSL